MKYFLIFVIFLYGCSDEHELKTICSPFRMTISDAIPIQFWVNGVETYNQKEVCGITPACFCQPFNCDDEIRIQFQDTLYFSFDLVIKDSNGNEIARLTIPEVSNGVYGTSFVPSELDICDEQVRISIVEIFPILSDFYNYEDPESHIPSEEDYPWTLGANPTITLAGVASSDYLISGYHTNSGQQYAVNYTANFGTDGANLSIYFMDSNYTKLNTITVPEFGTGVNSGTVNITPSADGTYIAIKVVNGGIDGNVFTLTALSITDSDIEQATSDCIDIRTSHDCTQLIRYDNAKDFADIEYSDFSPTAEFYIRIPGIFFHERNTEEQERIETSGETIVRLRDEVKVKRLLEVGYMPDYMHRKLLLILAHDTIEIDGETWVRNDPYEKVDPANKRYPLKRANVLLTQQGYIKRNIL